MAAKSRKAKKTSSTKSAPRKATRPTAAYVNFELRADVAQFNAAMDAAEKRAALAAHNIGEHLRAMATIPGALRVAIGASMLEGAGVYAGIVRGENGAPDYHLVVMDQAPKRLTWKDAMKWAADQGFSLPTRREQSILFGNVPELFEKAWYWSSEQYAGDEGYAWYQGFGDGNQDFCHKNDGLRARAVRRLPL